MTTVFISKEECTTTDSTLAFVPVLPDELEPLTKVLETILSDNKHKRDSKEYCLLNEVMFRTRALQLDALDKITVKSVK